MSVLEMKYFVLNPNKNSPYGIASRDAIRKYAEIISPVNKELAEELLDWIGDIEDKLKYGITLKEGE